MSTTLPDPPGYDDSQFRITEATEYFWPEIWNALIDWHVGWYRYLTMQADYYQQAIDLAAGNLRAAVQGDISEFEALMQSHLDEVNDQRQYIEQNVAVVSSALAAVNMPTFAPEQAGSLMMTDGTNYQLIRPIFRPPAF